MASKRSSREEGNDGIDRQVPGKRRHGDSEQEETNNMINERLGNGMASLLRRVIREEISSALQRRLSPCYGSRLNRQSETSRGRALQLCFMNQLPKTMFTNSKIIAEDGAPLKIELCDATNQPCIVNEENSLMKVKLYVLDGDAKTLIPRERKGPLLLGDTDITLENGVGYITKKVVFSDSSRWTRIGMFRLGVQVVQSTFIGPDIRDGISEPIRVKDSRGEVYKKHDCPSLNDDVWRLKGISKNGIIRNKLSSKGISTIKDMLQLYITNQASLKEIIGNIRRKLWDTIIEHAKACYIDDDERYVYRCLATELSLVLVFNCIYEVVEVSFNLQNFRSVKTLNLDEKRLVEIVKQQAYTNVKDNLELLETTPHDLLKTLAGVQPVQHGALDQPLQHFYFPIAQQGQPEMWPNMCGPSTSTSNIHEATHNNQLGSDQHPESREMAQSWLEGNFTTNDGNEWSFTEPQSHTDPLGSYSSLLTPWEQQEVNFGYLLNLLNGDGAESSNHSCFPNTSVNISSKGNSRKVWFKLRNAFKWVMLHLSKKRKAN